jgi:3-hydroxyisobutyrate dehydrogenase-like beta-hydroxyacid dehydrogenase
VPVRDPHFYNYTLNMSARRVGILHPGAMGASIAASAMDGGCEVYWASEGRSGATKARAADLVDSGTVGRMCEVCSVIVSVCPPEFAFDVTRTVKAAGFKGVFADVNALTPQHKIEMGRELEAAGIRFADGGVIGLPSRVPGETTLFLSGPAANEVAACFANGAIAASVMGPEVGRASALKILFAAYNKGTVALFTALYAAAEHYGVAEELKGQFTHRGLSVEKIEAQILRAAPKAWRWVAEMYEISEALEAAGMPGEFHQGAAKVYDRLRDLKGQDVRLDTVIGTLQHPR